MTLSTNTQRTIVARRHGWEGASPGLLAKVFDTTPQHVTAIVAQVCAACGRPICGCTDDQWRGAVSSSVEKQVHWEAR